MLITEQNSCIVLIIDILGTYKCCFLCGSTTWGGQHRHIYLDCIDFEAHQEQLLCDTVTCSTQELLVPLVTDTDVKIDVAGFAALSLGLVFTSTCNGEAIDAILQALMLRGELELSSPFAKFLALGLGLLFLGRQEAVEATVEVNMHRQQYFWSGKPHTVFVP